MIEKRDFDLGKPSDHEKLEEYLTKKEQYAVRAKKTLIPALQKTFLKLVHELVKNDEVTQYKNMMMFKRIKEKLEAKEEEKRKLKEELASDYASSETVSTENNSILSADEKAFLKAHKEIQAKEQGSSHEIALNDQQHVESPNIGGRRKSEADGQSNKSDPEKDTSKDGLRNTVGGYPEGRRTDSDEKKAMMKQITAGLTDRDAGSTPGSPTKGSPIKQGQLGVSAEDIDQEKNRKGKRGKSILHIGQTTFFV